MTRRDWAVAAGGAALAAACSNAQQQKEDRRLLIDHPKGGYRFLKGGGPYSSAVLAAPGFEIVHAILRKPAPLAAAFRFVERRLEAEGRPIQALCAMELRIPEPLSNAGFDAFNRPYIEKLQAWDVHVDGLNPVARTNVAPPIDPVGEGSVYAFSYTVPSSAPADTFVIAGAGEFEAGAIVAQGDTSPAGLVRKARRVMAIMAERLAGMGLGWEAATQTVVYCVHDIHPLMATELLPKMGGGAAHGIRWHYAAPPVHDVEFEMDVRGVRREILVEA